MKIKFLNWCFSILLLSSISTFATAKVWQWTGVTWIELPYNQALEFSFFDPWPTTTGIQYGFVYNRQAFSIDRRDGFVIWEYVGPTTSTWDTTYQNKAFWNAIDNNNRTAKIVSTGQKLYQMHNNGRIWAFTNRQWIEIDRNDRTRNIVIASGNLFQLHNNGDIWRYDHSLCLDQRGGRDCWIRIDSNSATRAIREYNESLIQLH